MAKAKKPAATIRAAVEGITAQDTVNRLATAGLELSKTFTEIQASVTQELQNLANVREAVALETEEVKRLHQIRDLAVDIQEQKEMWAREQEEEERRRNREADDYVYAQRVAQTQTRDEETQRRAVLQRDWNAREAELKARETELVTLRETVAGISKTVDAEVSKAVNATTSRLSGTHEHAMAMIRKDVEAATKLHAQEIASLKSEAARHVATITAMETQLRSAHDQVQTIAAKALEASSGQMALKELRDSAAQSRAKA